MRHKYFISVPFALLFCACSSVVDTGFVPLQSVSSIINDKNAPQRELLSGNDAALPSSDIFIIGSEDVCWYLSNAFKDCDNHDNVDASENGDLLPDFAGEYINSIVDSLGIPFLNYLERGRTDELRRLAVDYSLTALDTLCYLSRYDTLGLGVKNKAKVIVLGDVFLSTYGEKDVDTLFSATGCGVMLFSPIRTAFRTICEDRKAPVHIGVLCREENIRSNVYSALLMDVAGKREMAGSECYAYHVNGTQGCLQAFLSKYMEYGHTEPLDAIVIDDPGIMPSLLKRDLESIRSIMEEDSMKYGKTVSRDFRILDFREITTDTCYKYLRNNNLFTHNIQKPICGYYYTIPADGHYMLISSNVQN